MSGLIAFWKKDFINKLIVFLIPAIILGAGGIVFMLLRMPRSSMFYSYFFPTETPIPPTATFTPIPTPTTFAFTLQPTASPTASPGPAVGAATSAAVASPTPVPPTASPTISPVSDPLACVPDNPPQQGRVVEVLDGNTVRVLIEDKVYIVRYIGVSVLPDSLEGGIFGPAAAYRNGELVYGKDVTLVRDVTDMDQAGRLLRYVIVGDTFVNYEMIRLGLGTPLEMRADASCAAALTYAQQVAISARAGMWEITPTP